LAALRIIRVMAVKGGKYMRMESIKTDSLCMIEVGATGQRRQYTRSVSCRSETGVVWTRGWLRRRGNLAASQIFS
jgi:hypothetical protein